MPTADNKPPLNSLYRGARFLISAAARKQFPGGEALEVGFAGRSNAGKSSAINRLCDNKSLAKTSKTPGRTRLVNFFALDEQRRLVDLPGYGYAKVPEQMKRDWEQLMEQYLAQPTLAGLVVIMDIRHPLKDFDRQMLAWAGHYGIPCHVLLTKSDKLKKGQQAASLLQVKRFLGESGLDASAQKFSALNGDGLDELALKLNGWFGV